MVKLFNFRTDDAGPPRATNRKGWRISFLTLFSGICRYWEDGKNAITDRP